MRRFFILISLIYLTACQLTAQTETTLTVDMYDSVGDMVGSAKLSEQPDGVKIQLSLEGLSPGFHGLHVHEFPKCDPPNFKSAGNHLNPDNKKHGLLHPKGAHLGDLQNIEADQNGSVDAEIIVPEATLLKSKNNSLMNQEGTSLIVTSEADDGMTQISGNSGERIICGEIKREENDTGEETPTDPTEHNEEDE